MPNKLDTLLPIRGFCIAAPQRTGLDEFVKFIDEELAPRNVNTLILRVDYNYQYESHPELRDSGEVKTIRDHLALSDRQLWIWGNRLIDGKTTGIGEWEGSYNSTHRAVDMIPKDVMICDWHYERPDQTPVYFAMKGLSVVTCPWRMPENAVKQAQDMVKFREYSTPEMKECFMGMVQTVWSGTGQFLDAFYGRRPETDENTPVKCFKALSEEVSRPPNP